MAPSPLTPAAPGLGAALLPPSGGEPAAAKRLRLQALAGTIGRVKLPAAEPPRALPLGIAAIDAILPDGGLPRGAVVELVAPWGLGLMTRLALAACAAAQRAGAAPDEVGWSSWVDASHTLYAPGVAEAGVDLDRLLVVRPERRDLARVAVRLAASRIFGILVVDRAGVPGATEPAPARWDLIARRLALATEHSDTTVLLLSTADQSRRQQLPVALRLELSRPRPEQLCLHITKERRGRTVCGPQLISLAPPPPVFTPRGCRPAAPRRASAAGPATACR